MSADARTFVHHPGDLASRFGGRTIAAIILLVIGLALIGVTTSLSWWDISASNGTSVAFYLTEACSSGTCGGYQGQPGLQDVFVLTNDLVLIGLALAVFTLILFIVAVFYPRLGIVSLATGLVAAILLLAGPVYLYVALPGAVNTFTGASAVNSFFGSYTSPGGLFSSPVTSTWGGGSGWYLAFAAFAVLLLASVIGFLATRRLAAFGSVRMATAVPPSPGSSYTAQVAPIPPGVVAVPDAFCPTCGTHYPAGTQFCSRDATPLKPSAP